MSRVGGYFLDGAIGYGQRNGRALWWLLLILVIDTIAFHFAHAHGQIRAVHAAGRHQFQAVAYALDSLLPIVNLHQRDTFVATGYARWIVWVSVLLGWALATAVAAALAGLLRTRDS